MIWRPPYMLNMFQYRLTTLWHNVSVGTVGSLPPLSFTPIFFPEIQPKRLLFYTYNRRTALSMKNDRCPITDKITIKSTEVIKPKENILFSHNIRYSTCTFNLIPTIHQIVTSSNSLNCLFDYKEYYYFYKNHAIFLWLCKARIEADIELWPCRRLRWADSVLTLFGTTITFFYAELSPPPGRPWNAENISLIK
jgi:hypothetical protein